MGKLLAALALLLAAAAVIAAGQHRGYRLEPNDVVGVWQQWANPGPLARGHAALDAQCATCHTPLLGPDPAKCTACHADGRGLLARQSTAFHADVRTCRECHLEHLGRSYVSRRMDHRAFARIAGNPQSRPDEAALDCAACHSRRDRHQGQFGADCATCHGTAGWRIAGYVHPSVGSTDCAQCHLEPPSHRMMHFEMVSKTVAGQMHAEVRQCFLCHQATSWNDIKGVGWYKHH